MSECNTGIMLYRSHISNFREENKLDKEKFDSEKGGKVIQGEERVT